MSATTQARRSASTKRQRRVTKTSPLSGSRVVQPMPAPGETAVVGLSDWPTYVRLDEVLTKTGQRVRYYKGILEIMGISFEHDSISRRISLLVAAYCEHMSIDFEAWGSTTQRKDGIAAGEPDESFTFGVEAKERPDLVIEVGLSSGGIDKLEFWATLGAKEVWVWQNDRLHSFAPAMEGAFQPISESRLLPGLKAADLEAFIRMTPSSKAVREFRKQLHSPT